MRSLQKSNSLSIALMSAFVVLTLTSVGCGGLDENDIQRYAFSRGNDEEEDDKPKRAADNNRSAEDKPAKKSSEEEAALAEFQADNSDNSPSASSNSEGEYLKPEVKSKPKTAAEKAALLESNLTKVVQAIQAYQAKTSRFPPLKDPTLSWRVELLPYLGYDELYSKFKRKEPWFSPANKALIDQIPAEYQMIDGKSGRTNLMMLVSKEGIYQQRVPLKRARIEDGLENTIFMVMSDQRNSAVWTEPKDFTLDEQNPLNGLGKFGGNYVIALGNGFMGAIPSGMDPSHFRKMITADGGESVNAMSELVPLDMADFGELEMATEVAQSNGDVSTGNVLISDSGGTNTRIGTGSRTADKFSQACWNAGSSASLVGQRIDAWRWVRGSVASGMPNSSWIRDYKWIPGIRRPSYGLHIAAAISGSANGRSLNSVPVQVSRGDFMDRLGWQAQPVFVELEQHSYKVTPEVIKTKPFNGNANRRDSLTEQYIDSLTLLSGASEVSQAQKQASLLGADVLIYFDVRYVSSGQSKEVEVKVYDLLRNQRIHRIEGKVVDSTMVPEAKLAENIKNLKWELSDYLEDELTPTSWPVKMDSRLALRRIDALATEKDIDPLIPLAEMRYYASQGLVDQADLLGAVDQLIGKSKAMSLLLGSEKKKIRALREWLPSDDPKQYALDIQRQQERRAADDDD